MQSSSPEAKKHCLEPQPPGNYEPPTDLRATLHQAQRAAPGALPPFIAECFHHYAGAGAQHSWPSWLKPANLRDAQGREPNDPKYNQGTLWVPNEKAQKDEGHGTPMLLQYWKLKSSHFDKIAFFKIGKFYELFYYDAHIAVRECNLKWMATEKKPHVGFPEIAKHDYAKKLVDAGYKVVVVEQVERVEEQKQRNSERNSGPTCVERDACEVFTKGTLVDPELLGSSVGAMFLMYLHFEEEPVHKQNQRNMQVSVCLVDCATSHIQVGNIRDAPDRNALRTLLAQVQPSEIVYTVSNLPSEVLALIKRLPCRPQLSPLHTAHNALAAKDKLAKYRSAYPEKFATSVEAVLSEDSATIAAAGILSYLENALLGQRILPFAIWDVVDLGCNLTQSANCGPNVNKRMMLDATALSALEVLETSDGTYKGSLLEFLDHTCTPCGFRLLKNWLCAPLYDAGEIKMRHEAVEFFINHVDLGRQLQSGFKKISVDLERMTSRVWGFALQAERHAVMYEDITAKRLGDFKKLLRAYEQATQVLGTVFPKQLVLPRRLTQIAQTQTMGGSFPELQAVITRLCDSVVEVPNVKNNKVKYRPANGADEQHDSICQQINGVLDQLEHELKKLQTMHPRANLAFVHRLPGFRYEVECADEHALPQSFMVGVDVTSRLKDRVRFQTTCIKKLVSELDLLENRREDCIFPFLSRLFKEFHAHQAQFREAVRCIAEIDALLSLSFASQSLSGSTCNPEFVMLEDANATGTIELRDCRHPVAAAKMGTSFVPNDTTLNASGVPGVLVVTGPNMGGKSTVLRQTCIAVIMAQIGCRVNAALLRLSPVDRIFTRIGSYDTILEGKSTLLIELEETSAILKHASTRSIAVLDELGRGTSTFDGAAIASAVLDELVHKVQCLVLFATHYHPVSHEASLSPKVAPFHMAAEVDERTHETTFLYRFLPGLCPASLGHNVARLAGLPPQVLEDALARSAEFEKCDTAGQKVTCEKHMQYLGNKVTHLAEQGDTMALRVLFKESHHANPI